MDRFRHLLADLLGKVQEFILETPGFIEQFDINFTDSDIEYPDKRLVDAADVGEEQNSLVWIFTTRALTETVFPLVRAEENDAIVLMTLNANLPDWTEDTGPFWEEE
jgi:hypothetical protein